MTGFATALGEITLVLFTTLAPSGALAIACMGLPIALGIVNGRRAALLGKFLAIPIVVTLLGLIASATHLGNPANALYVFMGVGRSPLSNEVFAAVVFLALIGLYWLYSFAENPRPRLVRIWMTAIIVSAVVFVVAVAYAYDVETISSWHTPFVAASLCASACVGAPLLLLASLRAVDWACACEGLRIFSSPKACKMRALLPFATLGAATLAAVLYAAQSSSLEGMENHVIAAADLVPGYSFMIAAFLALVGAGVLLELRPAWRVLRGVCAQESSAPKAAGGVCETEGLLAQGVLPADRGGVAGELDGAPEASSESSRSVRVARYGKPLARAALASLLVFAGMFVMRFAFYMMHMTVGVSLP